MEQYTQKFKNISLTLGLFMIFEEFVLDDNRMKYNTAKVKKTKERLFTKIITWIKSASHSAVLICMRTHHYIEYVWEMSILKYTHLTNSNMKLWNTNEKIYLFNLKKRVLFLPIPWNDAFACKLTLRIHMTILFA